MPLLALVDGENTRAFKGGRGECSFCGDTMIAKCGQIIIHHWAHAASSECDPWRVGETEWHLLWKERFFRAGAEIEVPIEKDGVAHRADVVLPHGMVVELAATYHPVEAIESREAFYSRLVWLYNTAPFFERLKWIESQDVRGKSRKDAHESFRWDRPALSLAAHQKALFWHDIEADEVAWVKLRKTRYDTIYGDRLSRWVGSDEFVAAGNPFAIADSRLRVTA